MESRRAPRNKSFRRSLNKHPRRRATNRAVTFESLENRSLLATITGGAGPGGLFNTSGTSNLQSWLKADAIQQSTGSAVTTWADASGHNNNATSVAPPTLNTAGANGTARLEFGGGQFMTLPTPAQLGIQNSDYEMLFVARSTSGGIQFLAGGAIEHYEMHLNGSAGMRYIPVPAGGNPGGYSDIGAIGAYSDSNLHLLSARVDPLNANRGVARANGIDTADVTTLGSAVSASNATLFLGQRADNSFRFVGSISEVLFVDRSLTATERTIIESALAAKYGTSVAGDRYAGDNPGPGNYDLDVIGIGRTSAADIVSSAGNAGFGIEATASLDDTDFVLAGHKTATNFISGLDLPTGLSGRWDRTWYVDATGSVDANLAFDFSDAGLSAANASNFRLLFHSTNSFETTESAFTALSITPTVVGDTIVFNVPSASLLDGYYTIGFEQTITGGTGPGGLFDTAGTSNLQSWLVANTLAQANGSPVATWTDSSGHNNHAIGTVNPATFNAAGPNGNSQVNFTAGQYLNLPTPASLGIQNSDYEMIYVAGATNNGQPQFVVAGAGEQYEIHLDGGIGMRFIPNGFGGGAGASDIGAAGNYTNNQPHVLSGRVDAAISNRGIARADGTDSPDLTTGSGLSANNTALVLGQRLGGSFPLGNGFIAEALIFDRSLNSAERVIIDNALSAKYNTALVAGSNFYAGDDAGLGDYDRSVIGVGRVDANNAVTAAGADGLGLEATGSVDNGDFVLAGHKTTTNSLVTTDLPSGVTRRWDRTWYVDVSGTGMDGRVSFDFSDAGVAVSPQDLGYQLLYHPTNGFEGAESPFIALPIVPTVVGDRVTFDLPAALVADGYITLGIVENQPPVLGAPLSSLIMVVEDSTATITNSGSFSAPELGQSVTITASTGNISQTDPSSGTWNWSLPTNDNTSGIVTVTITATDSLGLMSTTTFDYSITNVAPTPVEEDVTINGLPATINQGAIQVVPGMTVEFSVSASDPALNNVDAPFTFTIDFGDGSLTSIQMDTALTEGEVVTFSHVYTDFGAFQPTVTVADADGGVSLPLDLTDVNVGNVASVDGILYVYGTDESDRIIVQLTRNGLTVRMNNRFLPGDPNATGIVVMGNEGNDTITFSGSAPVPVTFFGGEGDDYLSGSSAGDILDGGAGRDRIFGNGGDDTLLGGDGNDSISGGAGLDYILGDEYYDLEFDSIEQGSEPGNDSLSGDNGNDTIVGGEGSNVLNGGNGNDLLLGGNGGNKMDGGSGDDILIGGDGSDTLFGRAGKDVLLGGGGIDKLYGGSSADLLYAGGFLGEFADYAALWMWSTSPEDAVTAVSDNADDDFTSDALYGEGDTDLYLIYDLDFIMVKSELKNSDIRPAP